MADIPVIQVLEKDHYFTQHLVTLPDAVPYPPLGPSSVRVRTKVMCLTSNNITYAKLGFLLKWWDVHPLPPSTPAPFNDAAKYGRINCWGFAEVLESTLASVEKGSYLWGYLPIGTLAQDLVVGEGKVPNQVIVKNEHRQDIMPIYNRYLVYPPSLSSKIEAKAEEVAYDALIRVMFEMSYLMNRFVFTSDPTETVNPRMDGGPWTSEAADSSDATFICLAPGSKVALCFARELRQGRSKPVGKVIGAASEHTLEFVAGTGEYDEVVSTKETPDKVLASVDSSKRVILMDFGGRGGVAEKWADAISKTHKNSLLVRVGGEISEVPSAQMMAGMQQMQSVKPTYESVQVNASDMRDRAMAKIGEAEYFEGLEAGWKDFNKSGIKGLTITWGDSMEDVKKGWDLLCTGNSKPNEGLAYVL
ncbi:hypothetical protein VMCG_00327 [Cytospora schulzeri]|uniref:Uncharacterized protein n=1 Tax=Cytospora schulzeri TaxID=448051 RepID=A0A423X8R1_9PEZI|nr:hypothetical protein VMCG_00327 [Valsa malicola]